MGIDSRVSRGRRQDLIRSVVFVLVGVCLVVGLLEILARVAGQRPYVEPDDAELTTLFEADSVLGYRARPGIIEVPGNTSEDWISVRHTEDGGRAVEPADNYLEDGVQPEIWCVGGTHMYGLGLSDRETIPWNIYDRLKDKSERSSVVRNMAVVGYTESQVYLLLRNAIEWGERPSAVVLPTFYTITPNSRSGRYDLGRVLGPVDYNHPVIQDTDPLEFAPARTRYSPFPLAHRSAFISMIDGWFRPKRQHRTDSDIVESTITLLREHGVGVVVLNQNNLKHRRVEESDPGLGSVVELHLPADESVETISDIVSGALDEVISGDRSAM